LSNSLSKKDKSDWKKFIDSKDRIEDKDLKEIKSNFNYKEQTIDLHGYSLDDANNVVNQLIVLSYKNKVSKINIITGKGSRSKNKNDPYQSFDLSILKYSVPNYIKNNEDLMKKIKFIDFDEVKNVNKGSFSILLKTKV